VGVKLTPRAFRDIHCEFLLQKRGVDKHNYLFQVVLAVVFFWVWFCSGLLVVQVVAASLAGF
jgi:hypothetical protein